jgi:NADH dehydrogenase [ubiquinone] 1 alpha subcomplex assembly factor 6
VAASILGVGRSMAKIGDAKKFSIDLLKRTDYCSYLTRHFIPRASRDAWTAVRAFNITTAAGRIDSEAALKRLEWRKWNIDQLYRGKVIDEPVSVLLKEAIQQFSLSRTFFGKILDARMGLVRQPTFLDLDQMQEYCENTYSSLLYLSLETMQTRNIQMDHVASHIGKALGISIILKSIPVMAQQGHVAIPIQTCIDNNTTQEDIITNGPNARGITDAVFQIATIANDHLITARRMISQVEETVLRRGFSGLLDAVHVQYYLDKLESADFNVFRVAPIRSNPILLYKIWSADGKARL